MDGVTVHRFRYWRRATQALADQGGMTHNMTRGPWVLLQAPCFLTAQRVLAVAVVWRSKILLVYAHWVLPQGVVSGLITLLFPNCRLFVTSDGADVDTMSGRLTRDENGWAYRRARTVAGVSHAMAEEIAAG